MLAVSLFLVLFSSPGAPLLRMPDIHQDKVVFVCGGDLWVTSLQGRRAYRLTSHPGLELFPRFSPDGSLIAFSGEYDGTRSVYVIPTEGGVPRRLTFKGDVGKVAERMGPDNFVMDWYPDGKHLLVRSRRDSRDNWPAKLYKVSLEGGLPEPLPLPEGGFASLSDDGKQLAYCRIFRDFRTWKRYKGGLAQDIWLYNFEKNTIKKLTHYEGMDHIPMWQGDKIYFLSERSGRDNLYQYDLSTDQITPLTAFTDYDVKWPAEGPGAIIFEHAGMLKILDLKTKNLRTLPIQVPDDQLYLRPRWVDGQDYMTEVAISPTGKRALIISRGDLFTVPAEKGMIRRMTHTSGAREKGAAWSPDGKFLAFLSDRSGEDEIYITPANTYGEIQAITQGAKVTRYGLTWSPDSKKLAFADKNQTLWWVDMEEKKLQKVFHSPYGEIHRFAWSPDSRWLTWDAREKNHFSSIYLYDIANKKLLQVTDSMTDDYDPHFSRDGNYLFFFSDRDLKPTVGNFEFNITYTRSTRLYGVHLTKDTPPLFPKENDEEGKEVKKEEKQKEPIQVRVEEGLINRIVPFPMEPGDYYRLSVGEGYLFYLESLGQDRKANLWRYDLKKRKGEVWMEGIDAYELSFDGKHILYKKDKTYGIVTADKKAKPGDGALNLKDLTFPINPQEEWKQMFYEAWRQERDFFYHPSMHGVDWEGIKKKYEKFLPALRHRNDLNFLMGEMLGELAVSHSYVGGGDYPKIDQHAPGLLGCDFGLDKTSGFYRIQKIYHGEGLDPHVKSPLMEPGANIAEGDFLLAIQGKTLQYPDNPYRLLEGTAGKLVTLTVAKNAKGKDKRTVLVKPLASEMKLRYLDWVEEKRRYTATLSQGKVGYVHIPDMSFEGLNMFFRQFFAQIRKPALVIDDRNNGGGFVSQLILERLRRVAMGMSAPRNAEPSTYPENAFYGYLACLVNHYSASDGDIFPYFFRKYNLGPIIGTRTWGGVIGIRGYHRLIDGGYITRPEFGFYDLAGKWIIENIGVEPDVVIDNLPTEEMEGKDPQLEKAVEILLKKIEEKPPVLPSKPPAPHPR